MEDEQGSEKKEPAHLSVNGQVFLQKARANDYVLYQSQETRTFGRLVVDLFLEYIPGKGWWGAMRFNGRLRIQLNLDSTTLFPTPEIALLATEEFLTDEQHVCKALEDMRKENLDLQTFRHVPPRPATIDPETYFSPSLLQIQGEFFTLYHLSETEATYRSWEPEKMTEITVGLRLTHIYWEGWQAGLRFPGTGAVMFEPAIDQFFLTPERGHETLLAFCAEEERLRALAQQLKQTHPQDVIVMRSRSVERVPARPALRVNNQDFVWKKQISEGDIYQAKRASLVRFKKISVLLVETWRKGWLGGLQFDDIAGIYFEKESDAGFSTPEEALAATQVFLALKDEGLRTLHLAHTERRALQCKIGRYDQILSISMLTK